MVNPAEVWKGKKHSFDVWPDVLRHAAARTPMAEIETPDLERMKWYGFFYRKRDTPGRYMNRIRITANELTSEQAREIAAIACEHGHGIVDVTTRANLQVQGLGLEHVPEVAERLAAIGLTSKQTGHDNIRNVFAHPFSGVLPDELIDTRQLCREVTALFVDSREYSDLPRKFNICLNGTAEHSVHFWTQDLAFLARRVGRGVLFQVLVAGTQGQNPHLAWHLPALVRPDQVVAVTAAVLDLFRAQGSREKRHQARLRYLVERIGIDAVREFVTERVALRPWPGPGAAGTGRPERRPDRVVPPARPRALDDGALGPPRTPGLAAARGAGGARRALGQRRATDDARTGAGDHRHPVRLPGRGGHRCRRGRPERARRHPGAEHGGVHGDAVLQHRGHRDQGRDVPPHRDAPAAGARPARHPHPHERLPVELRAALHGRHRTEGASACAGCSARGRGFDVYLGGGVAGDVHLGLRYKLGVDADQLPLVIEEVVDEYYQRHGPGETFSAYWRGRLREREEEASKVGEQDYRPSTWICERCAHRHVGQDPPGFCPGCAGVRRLFARVDDGASPFAAAPPPGNTAAIASGASLRASGTIPASIARAREPAAEAVGGRCGMPSPAAASAPGSAAAGARVEADAEGAAGAGAGTPPPRDDGFVLAARADALREGAGVAVDIGGHDYALFRVDGKVTAVDGLCPHAGGPLAEGTVDEGIVTCPLHGWRFDACTGRSVEPRGNDVASHPTLVEEGNVYLKPKGSTPATAKSATDATRDEAPGAGCLAPGRPVTAGSRTSHAGRA